MVTIECIGPPGAGKTSSISLVSEEYGEILSGDNGRNKCIARHYRGKNEIPDPLFKAEPIFELLWWKHLLFKYQQRHLARKPESLSGVSDIVEHSIDGESTVKIAFQAMALRELLLTHRQPNEIVILDDSLLTLYSRLLWNANHDTNRITDNAPIPDVLLYYRASPKTCLERQSNRERGLASVIEKTPENERLECIDAIDSAYTDIATDLKARGVTVVEIDTESATLREQASYTAKELEPIFCC